MAMTRDDLLRCIGELSDDLVLEAAHSEKRMRRMRRSTVIALAAVLILMLGISAYAVSLRVSSRYGHSRGIPDYYSVPTAQELQRDIGIQLNVVEAFSNGYRFQTGCIVRNQDKDADGTVLEQYRSLHCDYAYDGDTVYFHADAARAGNQMEDAETLETYKDCALRYSAYTNKIVPGDYMLTGQDRQDEDSGKYVFSYGGDGISLHGVQVLGFEYGGLNYSLCAIDSGLTKEQLVQMAKEIIDCQKENA